MQSLQKNSTSSYRLISVLFVAFTGVSSRVNDRQIASKYGKFINSYVSFHAFCIDDILR